MSYATTTDYKTMEVSHVKDGEVKLLHSERFNDWAVKPSKSMSPMFGYTKSGAKSMYESLVRIDKIRL